MLSRVAIVLVLAVLATSPLTAPVSAAPGGQEARVVLSSKKDAQAKKDAAKAAKDAAEIEKQARKCLANGTCQPGTLVFTFKVVDNSPYGQYIVVRFDGASLQPNSTVTFTSIAVAIPSPGFVSDVGQETVEADGTVGLNLAQADCGIYSHFQAQGVDQFGRSISVTAQVPC